MQTVTGVMRGELSEVEIIGNGHGVRWQSREVDFSLLDLLAKAIGAPAEAKRRAS